MGVALNWAGRRREAVTAFANARAVIEPWAGRDSASVESKTELLNVLGNAGDVDYLEERYEAAYASYAVALEMARAAAVRAPGMRARRTVYLVATRAAAALQETGRLDEAVVLAAESVAIQRDLAADDTKNVRLQFDLAASIQGQGTLAFKRARLDESARFLAESLRTYEAGMKASPSSTDQRFDIAQTWAWRGRVDAARGLYREAIAALRTGVAIYGEPDVSARKPSEQFEAQQWLGDALLAWSLKGGGRAARDQAREAYLKARDGLAALSKSGQLEPRLADVRKAVDAQLAALAPR
jgi:tetratricopeptide (TPR) repeat protein